MMYLLFICLSMAMNMCSQMLSMLVYKDAYAVEISIFIGTAVGLPIRYFLEKRYIFYFKSTNFQHDGKLFMLYSFMGIFTTAIFWSIEYTFHLVFMNETMRYFGALVGLIIGFYIKYCLDKKYVFVKSNNRATK